MKPVNLTFKKVVGISLFNCGDSMNGHMIQDWPDYVLVTNMPQVSVTLLSKMFSLHAVYSSWDTGGRRACSLQSSRNPGSAVSNTAVYCAREKREHCRVWHH